MNNNFFISQPLLEWFEKHKRDLPWRRTQDPYRIWISEIILQQTRVAQGQDYYTRFIGRFPDIASLAMADEQEVLKYWQGLGYYSRARNLHKAAKILNEQYGGTFPGDYKTILGLPGIGEYTAAAIVSFAWNMPYPTVDGNVFRVLSRLFAIDNPIDSLKGKRYFTELAEAVMDKQQPGAFNQAMMEFGALHCTPRNPSCSDCPFQSRCLAYANGSVYQFPVKVGKTKTKDLYLYYFDIRLEEDIYLRRRTNDGIWKNLYEFPLIESETPLMFDQLCQHALFKDWFQETETPFSLIVRDKKHVLSHRILYTSFYRIIVPKEEQISIQDENLSRIPLGEINHYPVHRLMQYYIEEVL